MLEGLGAKPNECVYYYLKMFPRYASSGSTCPGLGIALWVVFFILLPPNSSLLLVYNISCYYRVLV